MARRVDELPKIPDWVPRATHALVAASEKIRVIAANTPRNLRTELDRIGALDRLELPRFLYGDAPDLRRVRQALEGIAAPLESEGEIGKLYASRARELDKEAALAELAGLPGLWGAARVRFAKRDAFDDLADSIADQWLSKPAPIGANADIISDDAKDPRSLVARMRVELGKRRIAFRVVVSADLACLAATGEGFIQIVAGRKMSREDVERTVLHEMEGHVLPRVRARAMALSIFAIGTAWGSDDQEGRALSLERLQGRLSPQRKRELALRHVAARSVEARADFVETARALETHGALRNEAIRIAARVHRGGGLAREAVYIPALLRVEEALTRAPELDLSLGAGRVAVPAATFLLQFVGALPMGPLAAPNPGAL